jgi:hypothetical protein
MISAYQMDKTKLWTLISLLIIVPLGFYAKFFAALSEENHCPVFKDN